MPKPCGSPCFDPRPQPCPAARRLLGRCLGSPGLSPRPSDALHSSFGFVRCRTAAAGCPGLGAAGAPQPQQGYSSLCRVFVASSISLLRVALSPRVGNDASLLTSRSLPGVQRVLSHIIQRSLAKGAGLLCSRTGLASSSVDLSVSVWLDFLASCSLAGYRNAGGKYPRAASLCPLAGWWTWPVSPEWSRGSSSSSLAGPMRVRPAGRDRGSCTALHPVSSPPNPSREANSALIPGSARQGPALLCEAGQDNLLIFGPIALSQPAEN